MPVKDIAVKGVETADPETPVPELADSMAEAGVGSIVIAVEHRPVGIVTDRDLALRALAGETDPATLVAADVMTGDPATVQSTTDELAVATEMCERGVRRMPVVDDGDHLVGIVTLDDLFRRFVAELADLAAVVEAESPPY
jgi:CBS domain-containing protein